MDLTTFICASVTFLFRFSSQENLIKMFVTQTCLISVLSKTKRIYVDVMGDFRYTMILRLHDFNENVDRMWINLTLFTARGFSYVVELFLHPFRN